MPNAVTLVDAHPTELRIATAWALGVRSHQKIVRHAQARIAARWIGGTRRHTPHQLQSPLQALNAAWWVVAEVPRVLMAARGALHRRATVRCAKEHIVRVHP